MTTYTDSLGFNKGSAAPHEAGLHKVTVRKVELDFAAIAVARAAAGVAALGSADVLQVLPIPADTLVVKVGYKVTTAEGATLTGDVGDGDDADGFLDGFNLNSTGAGHSALALTEAAPNTVTGYSAGKLYTAADTIDITLNNAGTDAAVVTLWALCVDVS